MFPSVAPGTGGRRDSLTETPVDRGASTGPLNREVFDALEHHGRQRDIFHCPFYAGNVPAQRVARICHGSLGGVVRPPGTSSTGATIAFTP